MRRHALLMVGLAALGLAAAAAAATTTATPKQLKSYMTAFGTARAAMVRGDSDTQTAVFFAQQVEKAPPMVVPPSDVTEMANKAIPQLQIALDQLKLVPAPRDLRGPQASLRRGLNAEIQLNKKLGPAMAQVGDSVEIEVATIDAETALSGARDLIGQWRTELIVQLRRRGVTVPLWLKEFGT